MAGVVRASIGGAARQLQLRHGDPYAFNVDLNARKLVTHFLPPVGSRFDLRTVAPLSFGRCHCHAVQFCPAKKNPPTGRAWLGSPHSVHSPRLEKYGRWIIGEAANFSVGRVAMD